MTQEMRLDIERYLDNPGIRNLAKQKMREAVSSGDELLIARLLFPSLGSSDLDEDSEELHA